VSAYLKSEEFNTYDVRAQHAFEEAIGWLNEWGCSRTYGLGTQLPWDT
jgi:leucyl-tRNA synthetase